MKPGKNKSATSQTPPCETSAASSPAKCEQPPPAPAATPAATLPMALAKAAQTVAAEMGPGVIADEAGRAHQVFTWILNGASERDILGAIELYWPGQDPKPLIID